MRDWLVLLVALCGVVQAAEPPPAPASPPVPTVVVPRWEYGLLMPVQRAGSVYLAVETSVGESIPRDLDGNPETRNLAPVEFVAGPDGDTEFRNVSAALSWAGAQGWEIVQHLGRGQYLARRPVPPK